LNKVSIQTLMSKKASGEKIVMLAVHDYPFAKLAAAANVDGILVGDSIGMTVFGFQSLLPVTMDMMVPHVSAVRRGAPGVFLIGDLPFLTYEVTTEDAIRNAGRFMAECGCDAVKLEGGRSRAGVVKALVDASISVVGHIGFTPQEMKMLGGFQAPGQDVNAARRIVEDAAILEEAGACMLMLEAVPSDIAGIIAQRSAIPVCGFGSGADVDGQILLLHDIIGMFDAFTVKFSKRYVDMSSQVVQAIAEYVRDVETGAFPAPEHYAAMPKEAGEELQREFRSSRKLGAR
jgi:3-methyl-2-oxobutanoate hydroxymethyltransferase